jgi:hypothetical protein
MKSPLLILLCFLLIFSCRQEDSSTQASTKHGNTYDYYPKANIYYDIEQKYYLVFDSLQDEWLQKSTLTTEENALLDKKFLIANPSLPVYFDNDNHRLIYGTALYSSSEEINKNFIEDSLKILNAKKNRIIQDSLKMQNAKKENQKEEKEKKRKRGFKKFLDNIFRKKEDKSSSQPR